MTAKTKKSRQPKKLILLTVVLTAVGAALPLLLLQSNSSVPRLVDGALELVGVVGLGTIFLDLVLQK